MDSKSDHTKFCLGVEGITAINDGGLGIRYNIGNGNVQFQPGGIRPVLSLEVSYLPLLKLTSWQNDDGRPGKMTSN